MAPPPPPAPLLASSDSAGALLASLWQASPQLAHQFAALHYGPAAAAALRCILPVAGGSVPAAASGGDGSGGALAEQLAAAAGGLVAAPGFGSPPPPLHARSLAHWCHSSSAPGRCRHCTPSVVLSGGASWTVSSWCERVPQCRSA